MTYPNDNQSYAIDKYTNSSGVREGFTTPSAHKERRSIEINVGVLSHPMIQCTKTPPLLNGSSVTSLNTNINIYWKYKYKL